MMIIPEWPAPKSVKSLQSTRLSGVSCGPYQGLNLGDHVGDLPEAVAANRQAFLQQAGITNAQWLSQVHGTDVIDASTQLQEADGCYTQQSGLGCIVMTADCLPVLFCNKQGTRVAAVHAGWRGLAAGILQKTLKQFEGDEVLAWLGPAIGPEAFEVGPEVRQQFCGQNPLAAACFKSVEGGKYLADIYALARLTLSSAGVDIYGGEFCTFSDDKQFYSYRRDGVTGRMASIIWLSPDKSG